VAIFGEKVQELRGRPPGVAIFGEKVQELRQDSSQRTFARVTKLSIDVIQRAERGKATERTIKRLCRYAQLKRIPLTAESLKKNTTLKTAKT
jgi:transcriptional regulator with XRE-family HTH domain